MSENKGERRRCNVPYGQCTDFHIFVNRGIGHLAKEGIIDTMWERERSVNHTPGSGLLTVSPKLLLPCPPLLLALVGDVPAVQGGGLEPAAWSSIRS